MPPFMKTTPQGILLKVYVQPRAARNSIAGIHGEAIKIRLTAPPVEGAANSMCTKVLAKFLKIPKTAIHIVAGKTSRTKHILLQPQEGADFLKETQRLQRLLVSALEPKKQLDIY